MQHIRKRSLRTRYILVLGRRRKEKVFFFFFYYFLTLIATFQMNHTEDTKGYIMVTDCRFCSPDLVNDDSLSEGEVQIFDMTGFSLKHAARFSMSSLRIYMKFLHQAFPVRIKCIHMINCPPYLDRLISVVRPFISKEVFKLVIKIKSYRICNPLMQSI